MLKGLDPVLSFLTILPLYGGGGGAGNTGTLEAAARNMWLFPVAGAVIGLLAGSVGMGLSGFLDPLLVGLLVAASLAIVTGIHHADGLADFADGLAAKGTREKRIGAMRDTSTGAAGVIGTVLCIVGLVAAVSLTGGFDLFRAILISEILAKFSMVLMARLAGSAAPGSNSPFLRSMKDRRRMAAATALMLVPVVLAGGAAGLAMLGATIAVTLLVLAVSTRSFGGITGDVMGAANELARLASLVVFVTV